MADNLIFLHIPKNGGSTIHSILDRFYPAENIFTIQVVDNTRLNIDEFKNLPLEERQKIHLLKGHMMFGLHAYLYGSSKYITFLRKPEDRIVSFYYYVLRKPNHRLYNRIKNNNLSLYGFVTTIDQGDVNNGQVRFLSGINDTPNNMLEKALENIEKHFSFVGLLEKFDKSLLLLKHMYGWKMPYYRTQNKTRERMTVSELDTKTRQTISELNMGDNLLYETIEKRFSKRLDDHKNINPELLRLRLYNKCYSNKSLCNLYRFIKKGL